jgi:hypothetical protein
MRADHHPAVRIVAGAMMAAIVPGARIHAVADVPLSDW